jgi:hypothetical protein
VSSVARTKREARPPGVGTAEQLHEMFGRAERLLHLMWDGLSRSLEVVLLISVLSQLKTLATISFDAVPRDT